MIGTFIGGKHQTRKLLGEGAMGSIHAADHTGTGHRCTVKVISSVELTRAPHMLRYFEREASAAAVIDTQHIIQAFDIDIARDTSLQFLVMEFLAGEDVRLVFGRVEPLAPNVALRIAAQACGGRVEAHEAGVLHRDIEPGNLFLARCDASEVLVKLLDFGVASARSSLVRRRRPRPTKPTSHRPGAAIRSVTRTPE